LKGDIVGSLARRTNSITSSGIEGRKREKERGNGTVHSGRSGLHRAGTDSPRIILGASAAARCRHSRAERHEKSEISREMKASARGYVNATATAKIVSRKRFGVLYLLGKLFARRCNEEARRIIRSCANDARPFVGRFVRPEKVLAKRERASVALSRMPPHRAAATHNALYLSAGFIRRSIRGCPETRSNPSTENIASDLASQHHARRRLSSPFLADAIALAALAGSERANIHRADNGSLCFHYAAEKSSKRRRRRRAPRGGPKRKRGLLRNADRNLVTRAATQPA